MHYYIRTLGCQMNFHDSERIAGVLEESGYKPATHEQVINSGVDVYVINTCAVRENASQRLYGNLGQLASIKKRHPNMQIAVAGCLAQKDKEEMIKKAPWIDVVFGTYNPQSIVELLEKAKKTKKPQVKVYNSFQMFSTDLPSVRASKVSAWVPISVGCNNACTYCIVPSLRGKEVDRKQEDIVKEVKDLAENGVKEITLLGQNVNTYGQAKRDKTAFSRLLYKVGEVDGIKRIRFMSPHPQGFTDDVIQAMSEIDTVMPSLHMPLQSGSDDVLRMMRRGYNSAKYRSVYEKLKEAIDDIQITTDIIVGFPTETEEDFIKSFNFVKDLEFNAAYIFNYSVRSGTLAAEMPQIAHDVKQDRFERMYNMQEEITLRKNKEMVGKTVEILLDNEGKKDKKTNRLTGRTIYNSLVHVDVEGKNINNHIKDESFLNAKIIYAAPHHFLANIEG